MTILEFTDKVKETFNIEGEMELRVYHTESHCFSLTYSEINSSVSSYDHWEIEYFRGGCSIDFYAND